MLVCGSGWEASLATVLEFVMDGLFWTYPNFETRSSSPTSILLSSQLFQMEPLS